MTQLKDIIQRVIEAVLQEIKPTPAGPPDAARRRSAAGGPAFDATLIPACRRRPLLPRKTFRIAIHP